MPSIIPSYNFTFITIQGQKDVHRLNMLFFHRANLQTEYDPYVHVRTLWRELPLAQKILRP